MLETLRLIYVYNITNNLIGMKGIINHGSHNLWLPRLIIHMSEGIQHISVLVVRAQHCKRIENDENKLELSSVQFVL